MVYELLKFQIYYFKNKRLQFINLNITVCNVIHGD